MAQEKNGKYSNFVRSLSIFPYNVEGGPSFHWAFSKGQGWATTRKSEKRVSFLEFNMTAEPW